MRTAAVSSGLAAIAAVVMTASAFAQSVTFNYDRGTDFKPFRTYHWVPIEGAQHPDQATAGNITSIIDELLESKGYVKKDGDPVDLLVGYGTTIQDQQQVTGFGGGTGFRFGGGMGMSETSTIRNGTILLDIYSASGKLLIWRGTVTDTLEPSAHPDKRYAKLKSALTKLLKKFPPPVTK
jgi:hypothetical protein